MYIISVKSVYKNYIKDNNVICALKNVSYDFEYGKFYAIMGKSGAGKSTLLNCIGLLDNITKGSIRINNVDTINLTDDELSKIRKNEMGFVFQDYYLNPSMTSCENVMLPLFLDKNITDKDKENKSIELLKKMGLKNRINHFPRELSGGEQQRVAIARALINDPNIILADEPTGNLDKENEIRIFDIFKQMSKEGKCIIVVTHNNIVKKYADEIITLKNGEKYD